MISAKQNVSQPGPGKHKHIVTFVSSLSLLWRILLASVGSYLCTVALISLGARLCQLWLGWAFSSSLLGAMQLSFLLYSLLIMLVIASRRLFVTSLWLLAVTALSAWLNYWLAQGGTICCYS